VRTAAVKGVWKVMGKVTDFMGLSPNVGGDDFLTSSVVAFREGEE
jgi:hypothetical protein